MAFYYRVRALRERLPRWTTADDVTRALVPVGRVFFAAIFILSGLGHFSPESISYAAAHGVPMANLLVPLSGILALLGGLSIALGFQARIGALLVVLFLVPVTLMMHNFWSLPMGAERSLQQIMFMKNLSMLGGAILLMWFGAGPLSLDDWRKLRVRVR